MHQWKEFLQELHCRQAYQIQRQGPLPGFPCFRPSEMENQLRPPPIVRQKFRPSLVCPSVSRQRHPVRRRKRCRYRVLPMHKERCGRNRCSCRQPIVVQGTSPVVLQPRGKIRWCLCPTGRRPSLCHPLTNVDPRGVTRHHRSPTIITDGRQWAPLPPLVVFPLCLKWEGGTPTPSRVLWAGLLRDRFKLTRAMDPIQIHIARFMVIWIRIRVQIT